jgi:hypothetical protein
MNIEQVGSFRTRPTGDGSLEVWARGWRLDSPLYALIPAGLALMFVLSPMPIPMRVVGAAVMLGAALFVFRLTKPGLLLSADAVTIVGVVQTHRFGWESVGGFMGERRHDEGRILLVLDDERRIPLPGTLDPGELDPYGEEGEVLSAVDQLNRLGERARSGQLGPSVARPAEFIAAPPQAPPSSEGASRGERRAERKQLKAALKAVRLPADGSPAETPAPAAAPEGTASTRRPWRRKKEEEPAEELTKVAISEPEAPAGPPRRQLTPAPSGTPSHYPTPTYIPQAEYAQMLREQKAAEKAAAAAAAELRELADLDDPAQDELAHKEEFSDWETQ